MPSASESLSIEDIYNFVDNNCFSGGSRGKVGVELEWLTFVLGNLNEKVSFDLLTKIVNSTQPLLAGSKLSLEPGGQLELSTCTYSNLFALLESVKSDYSILKEKLYDFNIDLVGIGLDTKRPYERIVPWSRYVTMESFFDSFGSEGRTMMCGTASIQINIDLQGSLGMEQRWQLAHCLGPVLAACFANSPAKIGTEIFHSARLANWAKMDHSRTSPVFDSQYLKPPSRSWAEYALNAKVMGIKEKNGNYGYFGNSFSFRDWILQGHQLGYPTLEDFAYHLTTLFPPIRPKGWLELRMIDSLPDPWWEVAIAITTVLFEDPIASKKALEATSHIGKRWNQAAQLGLGDEVLFQAAQKCWGFAMDALYRQSLDVSVINLCEKFFDRYISKGLTLSSNFFNSRLMEGSENGAKTNNCKSA